MHLPYRAGLPRSLNVFSLTLAPRRLPVDGVTGQEAEEHGPLIEFAALVCDVAH
jgi:hypothetical protein